MTGVRFGDFVQIMLTERCNLRCTHCAVPEEDSPAGAELPTAAWLRFIDTLATAGVRALTVSGGEALLRDDACVLLDHALDAGIAQVTLITNGLLGRRTMRALTDVQRRHRRLGVHVSLDGAGPDTHDTIRGRGTFRATVAALERFRAGGGRVTGVHTVVHRGNVGELAAMIELVRSLGASVWTVFPVAALGRAVRCDLESLDAEQWAALTVELMAARTRHGLDIGQMGPVIGDDWPTTLPVQPRGRFPISHNLVVGPDGAMVTCPPLRDRPLGQAAEEPDAAGFEAVRRRGAALTARVCGGCSFRLLCTGMDDRLPWKVADPGGVPAARPGEMVGAHAGMD
ncbi:radical SAM protein [Dactylosporangium sp. NPDC005555]|uniref:radical SAM protein n=1 Tax=Dactylosporangium sp. NPDC005555 TaxID=3154889 RepID=UPI0033B7DAB7